MSGDSKGNRIIIMYMLRDVCNAREVYRMRLHMSPSETSMSRDDDIVSY